RLQVFLYIRIQIFTKKFSLNSQNSLSAFSVSKFILFLWYTKYYPLRREQMAIEIFSRREQKYLITRKQYQALIHELAPFMRDDRNGENGRYTVSSLYFDNAERAIYYETKNKLKYRQKLRLRVYGDTGPDGLAFFEVKQKHGNVVYKRRLTMPLSEANRYLEAPIFNSLDDYESSNPQVLREIEYF